MNSKFLTYFKRKRSFLAATLVGAIAVTGILMKNTSMQKAELSLLGEGVQTCFLRVSQSHTAKLLNQGFLDYLGTNFFNASEECFAEALSTVKNKFQDNERGLLKNLNSLSNEVHNFHLGLKNTDEKIENIGSYFTKIENLKDDTLEEIESSRLLLDNSLSKIRQLFFFLCGLFPFLLLWEVIERRRFEARLEAIENEALKQLQEGRARLDGQMEVVIKRALEMGEFVNCARLFENWSEGRFATTSKVYHELELNSQKKGEQSEIAPPSPEVELKSIAGLKEIAVGPLFVKVIDALSSRIFTNGILLDLDVNDQLYVMGREETLEQLVFHSIVRSIDALSDRSGVRRLNISAKRVGQTLVLEFTDNGEAFDSFVLDHQVGLSNGAIDNLELTLCRELSKELGGQMMVENVVKGKDVVGARLKLRLVAAQVENKKLTSIRKGRKKDLMRELQLQ